MKIFKNGERKMFTDEQNWEFLIEPIISFTMHQIIQENPFPRFSSGLYLRTRQNPKLKRMGQYFGLKAFKENIFSNQFFKILSIIEGSFLYPHRIKIFLCIVHAQRRGGLNEIRLLTNKLEESLKNKVSRYNERSLIFLLKRWYPKAFLNYNMKRISTRLNPKVDYRKEMLLRYNSVYFAEELEDNEMENEENKLYMQLDLERERFKQKNKLVNLVHKSNPYQMLLHDSNDAKVKKLEGRDPEKDLSDEERQDIQTIKKINNQKLKVIDFLTYCCKK